MSQPGLASANVIPTTRHLSRGIGSNFGLVRQILCEYSQHGVQLQSTLHAKHANARGDLGARPLGKILKIDALKLNLVAFFNYIGAFETQ